MTLLALLLALWATNEAIVPAYFAQCRWGQFYLGAVQKMRMLNSVHPALGYGLYIVPPVLMAWWFTKMHDLWFFSILEATAAVVLFVACLDYRRIESSLVPFLKSWRNQEWQSAFEYGASYFDYGRMANPTQLLNQTVTQYWVQVNRHLFAPLLWFAIFGLAGLVLYLFTTLLLHRVDSPVKSDSPAWKKIGIEFLYALDGVPARALAVTIAALCFKPKILAVAMRRFRATDRESEVVLKLAVKLGLDFQELPLDGEALASEGLRRIHSIQELRRNAFIFWLVVIAILTIVA